jgi:hypothetical protein
VPGLFPVEKMISVARSESTKNMGQILVSEKLARDATRTPEDANNRLSCLTTKCVLCCLGVVLVAVVVCGGSKGRICVVAR